MTHHPRWNTKDLFDDYKEEPQDNSFLLFSRIIIGTIIWIFGAFVVGLVLASFGAGIYCAVKLFGGL